MFVGHFGFFEDVSCSLFLRQEFCDVEFLFHRNVGNTLIQRWFLFDIES